MTDNPVAQGHNLAWAQLENVDRVGRWQRHIEVADFTSAFMRADSLAYVGGPVPTEGQDSQALVESVRLSLTLGVETTLHGIIAVIARCAGGRFSDSDLQMLNKTSFAIISSLAASHAANSNK